METTGNAKSTLTLLKYYEKHISDPERYSANRTPSAAHHRLPIKIGTDRRQSPQQLAPFNLTKGELRFFSNGSATPFYRGGTSFCGDRATFDLADRLAGPRARAIDQIANHREVDLERANDLKRIVGGPAKIKSYKLICPHCRQVHTWTKKISFSPVR